MKTATTKVSGTVTELNLEEIKKLISKIARRYFRPYWKQEGTEDLTEKEIAFLMDSFPGHLHVEKGARLLNAVRHILSRSHTAVDMTLSDICDKNPAAWDFALGEYVAAKNYGSVFELRALGVPV